MALGHPANAATSSGYTKRPVILNEVKDLLS